MLTWCQLSMLLTKHVWFQGNNVTEKQIEEEEKEKKKAILDHSNNLNPELCFAVRKENIFLSGSTDGIL